MRWLFVLLSACSYSPQQIAATSDAVDLPGDAPPGALCVGQFATVCLKEAPTAPFQLGSDTMFDTGILASCAETTAGTTVTACVLAGTDITIDANLIVVGPRPLVLLATGTITVQAGASIDAGSHRNNLTAPRRGGGANPAGQCNLGSLPTESGGGAGGSFVGVGGAGGTGTSGGVGGTTNPSGLPTTLRGGCPGGLGGNSASATSSGDGGGALWLLAGTSITVSGTINASGAAGGGGPGDGTNRGGAGGGSGGMIVLDAITLAVDGIVIAQGGGGAEGNNPGLAQDGDDGDDPDPATAGERARGGSGGIGQNGGEGGVGDNDTGAEGTDGDNGATTSGGGGGGGTGFITIIAPSGTNTTGTIAPTPR